MTILVSVLATGKLQTPEPRAQPIIQTPNSHTPTPRKIKKNSGPKLVDCKPDQGGNKTCTIQVVKIKL